VLSTWSLVGLISPPSHTTQTQYPGPQPQTPPVRVLHDALHEVVVHELEGADVGRPQVQVDAEVLAHAPQVVRVRHPGQLVDDVRVPAAAWCCGVLMSIHDEMDDWSWEHRMEVRV